MYKFNQYFLSHHSIGQEIFDVLQIILCDLSDAINNLMHTKPTY